MVTVIDHFLASGHSAWEVYEADFMEALPTQKTHAVDVLMVVSDGRFILVNRNHVHIQVKVSSPAVATEQA